MSVPLPTQSSDLFGAANTTFSGSLKAYAASPGSGPPGKTCADCDHSYVPARPNPRKRFWKCDLVAETSGQGTDIRARTAACRFFKEINQEGNP